MIKTLRQTIRNILGATMETYPFGFPRRPPVIEERIIIELRACANHLEMHVFRKDTEIKDHCFCREFNPKQLVREVLALVISLNNRLMEHDLRLRVDDARDSDGLQNDLALTEIKRCVIPPFTNINPPNDVARSLALVSTITMTIVTN
jgi:hypothetical protein